MCYLTQMAGHYRKYTKMFGAGIDIHEFVRLCRDRLNGSGINSKAMVIPFSDSTSDDNRRIN
ncbi:hypothetical protein SAMN05414139_04570 [Burkholderia sp. D7]|nr:hypothetical protein SAMN05414139_04570 [Burkholderia sp. D7]